MILKTFSYYHVAVFLCPKGKQTNGVGLMLEDCEKHVKMLL